MLDTPVLFLIFNRPAETKQVFEAIRLAAPRYLYIAADGPRLNVESDIERCRMVRQIIHEIDWNCEVSTLLRVKNLGCKKAVSEAITWFFELVEQGIILEDDCLPDQSFFRYCEVLLERFKHNDKIISIGGTNLGYSFSRNHSYSYTRFLNMWGWATWRRASKLVDYDMTDWKKKGFKNLFLHRRLQDNYFSLDYNWVKFWKGYFNSTANGEIDTWDFQWIFTQLLYKKLAVFPAHNLVKNIGFSQNATHTLDPNHRITKIELQSINFPLIHNENIEIDTMYEENHIKKKWFCYNKSSLFRILRSYFLNQPFVSRLIRFFRT